MKARRLIWPMRNSWWPVRSALRDGKNWRNKPMNSGRRRRIKEQSCPMAFTGDLQKARLLLDHGADIDAVDEEYRSTPLGYAARLGRREMVAFLLERGADVNKSDASWATPVAWARKKGYADIEADLRQAGAQ